jgi:hypothetical protein
LLEIRLFGINAVCNFSIGGSMTFRAAIATLLVPAAGAFTMFAVNHLALAPQAKTARALGQANEKPAQSAVLSPGKSVKPTAAALISAAPASTRTEILRRADALLEPSPQADTQDRWLHSKAVSLSAAEATELAILAKDQTAPYPARFLSVMLLAESPLPERTAILKIVAESASPSLKYEPHLSRVRSHEYIIRKIAIDSLARANAATEVFQEISRIQTDPRVRAYARRTANLVASGHFAQAREREDAVLARIADGRAQ